MKTHNQEIEKIIDRIFNNGKARGVFLLEGKLYDCPAEGAIERKYLSRPEYLFIGRYDCEVTSKELAEDIAVAKAEAAPRPYAAFAGSLSATRPLTNAIAGRNWCVAR